MSKTFRGLELESYANSRDPDSTTEDDLCTVRDCVDSMAIGSRRIDGYAFCAEHAAQVEDVGAVSDSPHIDKPFAYHKPSEDGHDRITKLRVAFSDLKARIEQLCPESRHRSVALTELETSAMWAIKAVVFNDPASKVEEY